MICGVDKTFDYGGTGHMSEKLNIGLLHDLLLLGSINTLLANPETLLPNVKPLNYFVNELIPENSINFLTGRTGTGKSILAMQMANALINGEPFLNYQTNFDGFVIYLDFELQSQIYKLRHGNSTINNRLIRLDRDTFTEKSLFRLDDDVMDMLAEIGENREQIGGSPFLIIDNVTYSGISISKNDEALKFIDKLHLLQKNYGYTILVIGHVAKSSSKREPIGLEHVLGSTTLLGAFSTIMGIGKSVKDDDVRYLKILKNSNGDSEFSIEMRLNKAPGDLHFDYIGETTESEHLQVVDDYKNKTPKYFEAVELLGSGLSYKDFYTKIMKVFLIKERQAKRWIELLMEKRKIINKGRIYIQAT